MPDPSQPPWDDAATLSRLESRLSPLLSVIAGMVDLIGFLTLGNVFTAHITGNLVVMSAVLVRGGPLNPAQALAIPIFMLAVGGIWLIARVSGRRGPRLLRLLLLIQFLLLGGVLILSGITKPSARPHGLIAGIVVMTAVCAMACQYALYRLALTRAVSTAVMTGNLTNTVLSLLDTLSPTQPSSTQATERLRTSVALLAGFLVGCLVAAEAVSLVGDWAWSVPVALAGVALAVPGPTRG
jgi:uncharacterized membrane protein YoaK (UPF0700 family)